MTVTVDRLPTYQESVLRGVIDIELQTYSSAPDYDIDWVETKQHENGAEKTVMSHALTHDWRTLFYYIDAQTRLMPDPLLRIRGTHKTSYIEDGYVRYGPRTDFDLTISLRDQLAHRALRKVVANSKKAYRGTRTRVDNLSSDLEACPPMFAEYCFDFCAYRMGPKR